ncbi:helix-turn-helix transcriptional regulator [Flavobacterium muglaense]|uniref:helix-turn-helix transcriptional regulator n=1 Tax=Flavobacterium muglaense TaxID=2764716 RepID=UPI001CED4C98|nr:helix-turn-helix transcriptional regulator [Flavobacterium muglaense]
MDNTCELKRLGLLIKQLRTARGLSQAKLGLLILKDQQSIHKVEAGEFNPIHTFIFLKYVKDLK